eukprot:g40081.t1
MKYFKDTLKSSLKQCNIDINAWEILVQKKATWRRFLDERTQFFENLHCQEEVLKMNQEKEYQHSQGQRPVPSPRDTCQVKGDDEAMILCRTAIAAIKIKIGDLQETK